MKLSKRERILLVIVIILALGAVYYFYYLNPFMTEMKGIENDIAEKNARLQTLDTQENQLKILETQIAELRKQNADTLDKIPTGFSQPELLYFLQQVIGENAKKASFNFDLPINLVNLEYTRATLNFFTDYDNLKKLLSELKASRFNNRILNLTVTTVPEQKESDADAQPVAAAARTADAPNNTDDTEAMQQTDTADETADTDTEDEEIADLDVQNSEDDMDIASAEIASGSASAPTVDKSYGLQVIMVVEFFNLKGDMLKEIPEWDTFSKGKTDLFR